MRLNYTITFVFVHLITLLCTYFIKCICDNFSSYKNHFACIDQQIVVAQKKKLFKLQLDVMEKLIFMVNPDFELHSIIIFYRIFRNKFTKTLADQPM